ncbi:MAG TPA: type II toxin-antitoxin system PemK/MazF family toxin [Gemmataceae bacterium]|jgi:mRNA interferase MazF
MNVQGGDVVLVDFPYTRGAGSKVRPALVVQNDRDNVRLVNTIIAQITGTTHRALEPTQVLIDLNTSEGQQSSLRFDSVVNCVNLVTLDKTTILRRLGNLPDLLMRKVNEALRSALELP